PCELALVGLRPPRRLRGQPGRVDDVHVHDDGQDTALRVDGAADLLHLHRRPVPGRPCPLLDDDQPLDSGAGAGDASPGAQDAGAATPLLPDGASRAPGRGACCSRGSEDRRRGAGPRGGTPATGASREAEEEASAPVSSEPVEVETTGETVGEAKWQALREL